MKKILLVVIIFLAVVAVCNNAWANWPFQTNGSIESSPTVADLNGDGNLEILVGTVSGVVGPGNNIYCMSKEGNFLWRFATTYGDIASSSAVADINGDGNLEILIGSDGGWANGFYCLDRNGKQIWKYRDSDYADFIYSPSVADLNGDGNIEILAAADNGTLYCLDKNGSLVWKYVGAALYGSSPAIADLDGDGNLEIVVGLGLGKIFCLDKNGNLLWEYNTGGSVVCNPTIADLDNSGNLKVIFGCSLYLYCLDKQGHLVWKYASFSTFTGHPAVADLNGDSKQEIVVGNSDNNLYCINKDGSFIWKYQTGSWIDSSAAVADLNGDGNLEILIGSFDGKLYCISNNGQLIWNYPAYASPLSIADLDGDGNLEVLFGTGAGKLYCLNKDGQTFIPSQIQRPIDPMPWSMFQHDLQRTGLYDRTPPTTPSVTAEGPFINHSDHFRGDAHSEDKESGVIEYQYKITQDAPDGQIIKDWTSAGRMGIIFAQGLNLQDRKTYYLAAKAKNGQRKWSEIAYSDGVTVDLTPPTTNISGIDGTWHNGPISITLTAQDTVSGVAHTYYTLDNFVSSSEYQTPIVISNGGNYTISYYSLDRAGNAESVKTASFQLKIDKTAPTGSIKINNNDKITHSKRVILNLSAVDNQSGMSEGAQMQFSNDNKNWSPPEPYSTTKTWLLTAGNGKKTVYARFKDVAGNWSTVYSDNITLHADLPEISKIYNILDSFMVIKGKKFRPQDSQSKVYFYGQNGTGYGQIVFWSDKYIACFLPQLPRGSYRVKVINEEGGSNSSSFKIR